MKDAEGIFGREKDDILRYRYVLIEGLDGNYQKAIDLVEGASLPAIDNQFTFAPKQLLFGQLFRLMGNGARAGACFDTARTILQAKIQERPDDARYYSALGIAYAGLGKKTEAIANGKRGVELLPVEKEAWRGSIRIEEMARIYAMAGDTDLAVAELERLLSIPSPMSKQLLQADPTFAPLRDNPRFIKLVSGN
jgi:serine/threonine-protein kinase